MGLTYGYWEFYKVDGWLELVESVNSQVVKGFIKELTYEDNELTIWIEWARIITLSGGSTQSLKMYFYGFLRWMEEMGVVIRDTFNL
jgi:hypothetical protein